MDLSDRPCTRELLTRLEGCASSLGRPLAAVEERHLGIRLDERDAGLVEHGLRTGLLEIQGNYLITQDPMQATAWLVEGDPARPCWEYVPHAAAYVELVEQLDYPIGSVRFETPESESGMSLDLAVLDCDGQVQVLGEVKRESRQIHELVELLAQHTLDPGKPEPRRSGGPSGPRREAHKLAHQLWQTRAPWLLLVAAGERLVFQVAYDDSLTLLRRPVLPRPEEYAPPLASDWPTIRRAEEDWSRRDTCPRCGDGEVIHRVIGEPRPGEMMRAPAWVHFMGCVVSSDLDRECQSCGHEWRAGH
jgi:hypothetical protein